MWMLFAAGSAVFAGASAILAKMGLRDTDSSVATALRTVVVLVFSWIMVFVSGSFAGIAELDARTVLFLVLSGLCTGASWLCYFRALKTGDINKVVPIDKSSTILTVLLAIPLFSEPVSVLKCIGLAAMTAGIFLMIEKKDVAFSGGGGWLLFAVLSAVFACLTSILAKLGMADVESNLGTALRTCVVLVMAWIVVFVSGSKSSVRKIRGRELIFIILSGAATGASWLCYFRALKDGPVSVVVPIDKLSVTVTVLFSAVFLKERLSVKGMLGIVLITAGTLMTVLGA